MRAPDNHCEGAFESRHTDRRRLRAAPRAAPSLSRRRRRASRRSTPRPDRSDSSARRRRGCSASALRNRRRRRRRASPQLSGRARGATRASSAGSDRAARSSGVVSPASGGTQRRRRDRRRKQSPSDLRRSPAFRSATRRARWRGDRHRARLREIVGRSPSSVTISAPSPSCQQRMPGDSNSIVIGSAERFDRQRHAVNRVRCVGGEERDRAREIGRRAPTSSSRRRACPADCARCR